MSSTKTVRFKKEEAELVERFLKHNPFFDYSSLCRTAVIQFIQNPKLPLKSVHQKMDTLHQSEIKFDKEVQNGQSN